METKVDDLLIPALLDRSIEYHTRKGLRTWCDCDYCYTKRNGTNSIYHVGTYVHYDKYAVGRHPFVSERDDWDTWARINARRKVEIDNLREKLKEKKQEL